MKQGKKLMFESFVIAFIDSLQHKDHLEELVDSLLTYE